MRIKQNILFLNFLFLLSEKPILITSFFQKFRKLYRPFTNILIIKIYNDILIKKEVNDTFINLESSEKKNINEDNEKHG